MLKLYIAFALFAVYWGTGACTHRSQLNELAIDAVHSKAKEFPHLADIRHNGRHVCSGAVLGKYDVLTAAHCVHWLNHAELTVIVGDPAFKRTHGIHHVAEVQLHPLFDSKTHDYDAAILKVNKPFVFGRHVDSVLIPHPGEELSPGQSAQVSGWSKQSDENRHIEAVTVTMISHDQCNQTYENHHGICDHMVCSGPQPDSDASTGCLADPGAPLVVDGKLYGITSWGDACTPGAGNTVVYTDVSKLEYFLGKNKFIYENALSELCAALQLVVSLLPMIPVVPAWVVTALNLLLKLLGC